MEHDDFLKHNNIIIENITPNEKQARLKITDSSLNPYGIVHGGLIFALGDTIMGLTCKNTGRKGILTENYRRDWPQPVHNPYYCSILLPYHHWLSLH